MNNHFNQEIVYSINVDDIQTVAKQEIERELTRKEIVSIEDSIAENILWYDAIAEAINYHIIA
ncbi:MAG: hypothetical protein IIB94_01870 [Candidatus Marinimicrobia bacterium]|nr:hypothetical protein [Candidatus Neomarinimicrobiota bacterium]